MIITIIQIFLGLALVVAGVTGWLTPISPDFSVDFYWRLATNFVIKILGVFAILFGAFVMAWSRPIGNQRWPWS